MLTGKQRRHLRALGHNLPAIATIGKEGISPTFTMAVDQALADHELVKIRVGKNALVDRHGASQDLAAQTSSEVAQVLGNTILLYRRHPEKPTIELPDSAPAQPESNDADELP